MQSERGIALMLGRIESDLPDKRVNFKGENESIALTMCYLIKAFFPWPSRIGLLLLIPLFFSSAAQAAGSRTAWPR